jgi:hypothetical protein
MSVELGLGNANGGIEVVVRDARCLGLPIWELWR